MAKMISQREIAEKIGICVQEVSIALCQTKVSGFDGKKLYDLDEAKADIIRFLERKVSLNEGFTEKWRRRLESAKRL